ncbi:DUF3267 domain-containing protein [Bacillus salitolerans]|uniref:DUF3267 domain-containing protein n=1 Tax=Bacillus salitolerans TaxID=1437434 RepID=A0ABW4LW08_9BACI
MNCWKTINLSKDYGFHRLFFLSFLTAIIAFIVNFLLLQFIFSTNQLEDNGLIYVLVSAFLLYPLHQIIHISVLRMLGKKVHVRLKRRGFLPIITIKHCQLLSKQTAIFSVLSPLLTITTVLIILIMFFPSYIHYFSILLALNLGVCVTDLLYSYQFMKAPKRCYMEESNGGYDILIQKY